MALLLKSGAVFLHIPKTGGTWVTHVLRDLGLIRREASSKHEDMRRTLYPVRRWRGNAAQLVKELPSVIAQIPARTRRLLTPRDSRGPALDQVRSLPELPFLFCFVRHPLRWYESWWKFMSGYGWRDWGVEFDYGRQWHPNSMLNGIRADDFDSMMRQLLARRPGYVTELFGWYTLPGIRFIGHQERLTDDLIFVLREMGEKFDPDRVRSFARVNVSDRPRTPFEWDSGIREAAERLEWAGIVRFGYDRPELPPPEIFGAGGNAWPGSVSVAPDS